MVLPSFSHLLQWFSLRFQWFSHLLSEKLGCIFGANDKCINHILRKEDLDYLHFMAGGNKILYLYDAIGNKLCKKIMKDNVVQNTTDYSGSFIYETGSSGGRILLLFGGTGSGRL